MTEASFICEIASEARSILWLFWWIPVIPFLSLCLAVWNLGLLWELKQESKNNPSALKEQLQERKRILIKGIAYASILPIAYLWFLLQVILVEKFFGVMYSWLGFACLYLVLAILSIYNIILFILSCTHCNFAIKHNLKKRRKEYIVVIVLMIACIALEVLRYFYDTPVCFG